MDYANSVGFKDSFNIYSPQAGIFRAVVRMAACLPDGTHPGMHEGNLAPMRNDPGAHSGHWTGQADPGKRVDAALRLPLWS